MQTLTFENENGHRESLTVCGPRCVAEWHAAKLRRQRVTRFVIITPHNALHAEARCLAERAVAGRLLAEHTQSCPLDVYGWDHPATCAVACDSGGEATCWGLYIEEQARKEGG